MIKQSKAFTLVEISIVLLILAISAAAITINFAGASVSVQKKEIIAKVNEIIFLTRQHARQTRSEVLLSLDLHEGTFHQIVREDKQTFPKWNLPKGFSLNRFKSFNLDIDKGKTSIQVSPNGLHRSFAIQFQKNDQSFLIIVSGLTGQCIEENTENVKYIFEIFKQSKQGNDVN